MCNTDVKPIRFCDTNCSIKVERYSNNNRIALDLVDSENDEPVARATVNVPTEVILDDEVIIKNYSENIGILEVLVDAEIISSTWRHTSQMLPICKLLIPIPE